MRTLRPLVMLAVLTLATACGGSLTQNQGKTCAPDPSQAKCATTPLVVPDSGLRIYAARSGRMMGTALDAAFLTSAAYDSTVSKEFSIITAANAQKWQTIHPARATYNYSRGDAMLAFAQSHGMKMRG